MARAGPEDRRRQVGDLDALVNITVVAGPRGPTPWERIGSLRHRKAIAGLAVATLAAGVLMAGVPLTGRGAATGLLPTTVLPNTVLYPTYLTSRVPVVRSPPSTYPLRCLGVPIALHDPGLIDRLSAGTCQAVH